MSGDSNSKVEGFYKPKKCQFTKFSKNWGTSLENKQFCAFE